MPNWCYNNISLELEDELYTNCKNILKKIKIPNDIIEMILIYTFNYDGNENNYLKQFCSELDNELDIGEGIDNFDVETRWGPPNDILEELSSKYILIKIINEYECTQDDFAGTYELLSGKYLKDESYDISEKAWEENGSKCKDYLLLELLSENFEIIDENNNSIKFKDISDIKKFCQKK